MLFSDKFQQSKVYVLKVPQLQFIDDLCTFLLCNRDRCVVSWYRKLWSFSSCSSSLAVDISFVIPTVQAVLRTIEIPELHVDKVVDALACRSCRFHRSTSSLSWRKGRSP